MCDNFARVSCSFKLFTKVKFDMRLIELARVSPQCTGLCMRFFKKALLFRVKENLEKLQTANTLHIVKMMVNDYVRDAI